MIFERWIKSWRAALVENFFLKVVILLLGIGFILNATFFKKSEKVIIVPPALRGVTELEKDSAPRQYLEQMGVFFAELAGNLAPSSADYQAQVLAKYSPNEAEIARELFGVAAFIKREGIRQSFYPESVTVEGSNPYTVRVEGDAERRIGMKVISRERVVYNMELKYNNFKVFLNSIWVDYPERDKKQKNIKEQKGAQQSEIELKEEPFVTPEEKAREQQEKKK